MTVYCYRPSFEGERRGWRHGLGFFRRPRLVVLYVGPFALAWERA